MMLVVKGLASSVFSQFLNGISHLVTVEEEGSTRCTTKAEVVKVHKELGRFNNFLTSVFTGSQASHVSEVP